MIILLLMINTAAALELNIYDSPSDTTKAVVVACSGDRCERLLVPKKTIEQDYATIEEWLFEITNLDGELK